MGTFSSCCQRHFFGKFTLIYVYIKKYHENNDDTPSGNCIFWTFYYLFIHIYVYIWKLNTEAFTFWCFFHVSTALNTYNNRVTVLCWQLLYVNVYDASSWSILYIQHHNQVACIIFRNTCTKFGLESGTHLQKWRSSGTSRCRLTDRWCKQIRQSGQMGYSERCGSPQWQQHQAEGIW